MLALRGHPDTTAQKCSRAENVLLRKTCRVISVIARKSEPMSCVCACVCVSVCAFDRVCKMPTIHTDTVCCQLYIWPRSTLQETGVIAQHLVKYKYKHVSNATITKTCIHCGQTAATQLFKVPLHLKIFFSHVKEDILIFRSLILILDSYRATRHD